MSTHTSANPEIKQLYINGHFCYVFRFGIVTNRLGIIRYISFYDKDFLASHPDIVVKKKSDSPLEDKCVHDSKLLIPTIKNFFSKHPLINTKTFLVDAAFDTAQVYKTLLLSDIFGDNKHFSKAYIPLNKRSGLENQNYLLFISEFLRCTNFSLLLVQDHERAPKVSQLPISMYIIYHAYNKITACSTLHLKATDINYILPLQYTQTFHKQTFLI